MIEDRTGYSKGMAHAVNPMVRALVNTISFEKFNSFALKTSGLLIYGGGFE